MKIKIVGKEIDVTTYSQFKVKADIELSRDDLKRNLYHLFRGDPDLLDYVDTIREKLIDKGYL